MKKIIKLCLVLITIGTQSLYGQNFWKKTGINEKNVIDSKRNIGSDYSNSYTLDINQFRMTIRAAPQSISGMPVQSKVKIDIPDLDGNFEKYVIYETSNMSAELAMKFPDIKSYRGVSLNNPAKTLSFGVSQLGISMVVFSPGEEPVIIEPATKDASVYLVSHPISGLLSESGQFTCSTKEQTAEMKNTAVFATDNTDEKKFRTFRLAVSVDGEFSTFYGGSVANSLAAINNLMNFINPIYERDLSIHMNLIAENDSVIYLDAANDPYTFVSNVQFAGQIQQNFINTITEAKYDMGILLSNQNLGGGYVEKVGSVCKNSQGTVNGQLDVKKGGAYVSSMPLNGIGPQGFRYAMLIAHELGHLCGANHTFSFSPPDAGSNREPGTGTTIMGYPGLKNTYDITEENSGMFLHYSISEINKYIKTTACATTVNIANNPPVVNAGSDYTIPKGTAFKLTAVGNDPDNDAITYSWEEADAPVPTLEYLFPDRMSTTNPNFRVYPPTSTPIRYLPPLEEVLNGSLYNTWNMVSDVTRVMKFKSLVRDNAGKGQTATDEMEVSVDGNKGPFKVTSIVLNQNYPSGTDHILKWNVGGTNTAPVNTIFVNILISTDGGVTFTPLVSHTLNDGDELITIPSTPSPKAYIMVEAVGNIYYAMSPAFAIDYDITLECNYYHGINNGAIAVQTNAPADINIDIPATNDNIEDIDIVLDVSYTDLKNIAFAIKSPGDQENHVFFFGNCPGKNVLRATFDQEGESLPMNCNNLSTITGVKVEPIRLNLSKYYGQNPSGRWTIRAQSINNVVGGFNSGNVNIAALALCTRKAIRILSTKENLLGKNEFQVYPNPSNGKFTIVMKNSTSGKILVFDLSGRLVHTQANVSNGSIIDLTDFAKGNYILVLETSAGKAEKKIIIK